VEQILTYGRVLRPGLGVVLGPPGILSRVGQEGVLVLDVSGREEGGGVGPW
jgi:hypothetical protein